MNFVELRFLAFFAIVFGVHWALRWNTARKVFLLACSYVFYGAWDWRFLGLILVSTALDYCAGLGIQGARSPRGRRGWLLVSLIGNLGILGFFKYYNFFIASAAGLLASLGLETSDHTLEIVLPVGISFYTFQTLSYSLDVFSGRLEARKSVLDLALFVAFFPQLVAGPIVRAVQFLPQLDDRRRFADVDVRAALSVFLVGFVKKAVVSDNLAAVVDPVFADPGAYGTGSVWLGMFLFHVQVYCDFSGYSDMAIGSAGLLGYRLPVNFDFPYLTTNMTTFWRRWHITLGSWLTDYVYIPLGGNRRGTRRTHVNILILFTLCGLWHGASWNYVLWGFLNGLVLAVERAGLKDWVERRPDAFKRAYVLVIWFITLAFFRTTGIGDALQYLGSMFLPFAAGGSGSEVVPPVWWIGVGVFMVLHYVAKNQLVGPRLARLPDWAFSFGFGLAVALVLPWVATDTTPFIYFQF